MISEEQLEEWRKVAHTGVPGRISIDDKSFIEMLEEITRLRGALQWYADGKHMLGYDDIAPSYDPPNGFDLHDGAVEDGKRARIALWVEEE